MRRFSLAWRLLVFDKRRFSAAVAGVAFAVILVLLQLGFYNAMNDSATKVHRNLGADLVMLPSDFEYFGSTQAFARVRLMQAASIDAVAAVAPVYVGVAGFKNVDTGDVRSILAVGLDPGRGILTLPDLMAQEEKLAIAGHLLFDAKSLAAYFGDVAGRYRREGPFDATLDGYPVTVDGLFDLGTSFAAFGTVVMAAPTYFALVKDADPGLVNLGLIRLKPGADPDAARQAILQRLDAADILIDTREHFIQREIDYWNDTAAIGFLFSIGAAMGVVVGSVIVYQILYTDVTDHLPEYATLKAIGYGGGYFARVVLLQSIILSLCGFVPGVGVSWFLYRYVADATGYTMNLTPRIGGSVFIVTVGMCLAAGLLAMRRTRRADPAELF